MYDFSLILFKKTSILAFYYQSYENMKILNFVLHKIQLENVYKTLKVASQETLFNKIITNSTNSPFTVASKITRRGGKERSKMKSEHKDCYRMTLKTSYYHRTTLRRFDKNQAWDVIQIHCKLHAEKKFSSCSSTRSLTYGWSLDSVVLRDVDMKVKIVWVCVWDWKEEKILNFPHIVISLLCLALLFLSWTQKKNIHLIPRGLFFCLTIVRFLSDWLLLWVHEKIEAFKAVTATNQHII